MRDCSMDEIDGRAKTRYEWYQEMHRCETTIRRQKDVANLAKACDDTTLRRQAQSAINALQDRYDQIITATGLPAEDSRMSVSGFRRVKASTNSAERGIINIRESIYNSSGYRNGKRFNQTSSGTKH